MVLWILSSISILILTLNIGLYLILQIYSTFIPLTPNLKKKYNASWALVTGSSSGIGKEIAWKLANQGLNLVLISLDDEIFEKSIQELRGIFKDIEIKKIGVDLSENGYYETIKEATKDIDISIIFCNAGYLLTGFFHKQTLESQMKNLNTNVTSAVGITHLFISKMIDKKLKGCIVFTSSPANCLPGPFAVMYAATKSFITAFGASIACEVKSNKIDVLVYHPSPVLTRFYLNQKKLDILTFFKRFAVKAEVLPDIIFGAIGKTVMVDIGLIAMLFRLSIKIMDYGVLATLISFMAPLLPDFKRHNKSN